MTNFDERLLDAHLLPIRDDMSGLIKADADGSPPNGGTPCGTDMACDELSSIGFLKRVVFGGGAAVGLHGSRNGDQRVVL